MKITFEEALSRKEWLHTELMYSLTNNLITQARGDGFFDVKLLVNGIELEPQVFNKMVNNIENYINEQAKSLVRNKLEEAENKVRKLSEMFDAVADKIKDELILIESVLIEIIEEQRKVGRNQILSSIESEVKRLRN